MSRDGGDAETGFGADIRAGLSLSDQARGFTAELGPWVEELERRLEANEKKPRRDRLSLLRIHEDLAALGLRGDAFLVQMESAAAANTVETKADASRLRLVLEGSRGFALGEGAVLTPGLEVGLCHDGGDAETGAGVEIGGRIRYADAGSGLTVEASARTLIAHEDSGYREWGAGGSVRLAPAPRGGVSRSRWRRCGARRRAAWTGCGRRATRRGSRPAVSSRRNGGLRARSATALGRSASAAW